MTDEIDMANEQVQKALDMTMRTINTTVEQNDTGHCLWCETKIIQKDKRRWCSVECRDENQKYERK
jgi:hypothetical protein